MQIIYRVAVPLIAAAGTYLHASSSAPQYAITLTAAVFVLTGLVTFLDRIVRLNTELLFCTAGGVFVGLFAGYLIQQFLTALGIGIATLGAVVYAVPIVFFGYVGAMFAGNPGLRVFGGGGRFTEDGEDGENREKILDTSVIIDGRILDIAETHFIDGPFIIPNFVLREIQLISDSPDPIKRNRGRRGLDMLNKLQQHGSVKVKISYADYSDTREVDAKLVKLARETGARLVTNDFNLNKVAELQGVKVLNLNNLTNALKPVVLPGEDIYIDVIKEGKDENQGIGYLEDGTMVVIENGGALLGKTVKVNVTSIIQTAAGKMIFTRAAPDDDGEGRGGEGRGDSRRRGSRRRGGRNRGGGGGGGSQGQNIGGNGNGGGQSSGGHEGGSSPGGGDYSDDDREYARGQDGGRRR